MKRRPLTERQQLRDACKVLAEERERLAIQRQRVAAARANVDRLANLDACAPKQLRMAAAARRAIVFSSATPSEALARLKREGWA